jgi:hypothetical protein
MRDKAEEWWLVGKPICMHELWKKNAMQFYLVRHFFFKYAVLFTVSTRGLRFGVSAKDALTHPSSKGDKTKS